MRSPVFPKKNWACRYFSSCCRACKAVEDDVAIVPICVVEIGMVSSFAPIESALMMEFERQVA